MSLLVVARALPRLELVACFEDNCDLATTRRECRATRWHSRSHTVSQRRSPGAKLCTWNNDGECVIRDKINYRKSGRWANAMKELPKGCNVGPTKKPVVSPTKKPTQKPNARPTKPGAFTRNDGFKCNGGTYEKVVAQDESDCMNLCSVDIGCDAAQFHPNDNVCLLKENYVQLGSPNKDRICLVKN